MRNRRGVSLLLCAVLSAGCASQAQFVDPRRRAVDVPQIETRETIPLRVAVHVHPEVVRVSRLWAKNTFGKKLWFGNYGYEVVDAAAEYFPRAFREAWMLPRFPDPGIDPASVDVVVVIESAGSTFEQPGPLDSRIILDCELTLGVYTVDGMLLQRYTAVGSASMPFDGFQGGGSTKNLVALTEQAGLPVRPSMRKALLEFPAAAVIAALGGNPAERARRFAERDESFWSRQRGSYEAGVASVQAKWPLNDSSDGVEHNQSITRSAALVVGLYSATLSQMPQVNSLGTSLNQATGAYLQQMFAGTPEYSQGRQQALLFLGGRGSKKPAQAFGGDVSVPASCLEFAYLSNVRTAVREDVLMIDVTLNNPRAGCPVPGAGDRVETASVSVSACGAAARPPRVVTERRFVVAHFEVPLKDVTGTCELWVNPARPGSDRVTVRKPDARAGERGR